MRNVDPEILETKVFVGFENGRAAALEVDLSFSRGFSSLRHANGTPNSTPGNRTNLAG
jgi:hypothetical protein